MTSVRTVNGPRDPSTVGRTLMHEHLLCDFYRVTGNLDHLLNDEALAIAELAPLTTIAGATIVECTTPDLGRAADGLRRLMGATGIAIVMGTGWYRQPFYPVAIDRRTTTDLAAEMVAELTVGVGETGIRAGIIGELGCHLDYLTAQEERVLRAAARAQRATGAPLTTHASMYPVGLKQLDLLAEESVELDRVIVGHCDTYLSLDYHLAILQRGAYVQFDTIGRRHINPDERRADALVQLLRRGWGERLLLSSDRCYRSDLAAFGGVGYGYVFTSFFDLLRTRGASDDELDLMTIANPRRVLAW